MMNAVKLLGLSLLISLGALIWIYPDLICHHLRFIVLHDTGVPYENTFTLISHFFQGGIQLFDRFDGMSYAYSYLTAGLNTISNMTVAALYIVCSPFLAYSGADLHHLYSAAFVIVNVIIRTLGGYLFLREFTSNRLVIIISLVYLNVFCSSQFMNNGMLTNNLSAYMPLLMCFILRFFKRYRCEDFCWALLIMTVAVANSALFALGYFYQVIHFFILSCLVVNISHRDPSRLRFWPRVRQGMNSENGKCLAITAGTCLLILLPVLMWAHVLKNDLFIAGSGLGDTHGRIENAFSVQGYFNAAGRSYALPYEFIMRSLDYTHTLWGSTWMFLGAGVFFFTLIGAIAGKGPYKYAVVLTGAGILLLNLPPQVVSLNIIPHWLNAVTNPFSFLVRSFHMCALLLPYVILPLMALGLEVCLQSFDGIRTKKSSEIFLARGVMAGIVVLFMFDLPSVVRNYVLITGGLVLISLYVPNRIVAGLALAVLMAVDLWAVRIYANGNQPEYVTLKPMAFEALPNQNPMILDYQNPRIFPWRYFYNTDERNQPLLHFRQNSYGLFYQYSPLPERYISPATIYSPRHISYRGIDADPEIQEYLKRDGRMVFLAQTALPEEQANMSAILFQNLDRRVVLVRGAKDHIADPRHLELKSAASVSLQEKSFTFNFLAAHKRTVNNGMEYEFSLPNEIPSYLTTTVFTADYYVFNLRLGTQILSPVQGNLSMPFSFDVGNVHERSLTVLLPADFKPEGQPLTMSVRTPGDITGITRNTNDELTFTYHAAYDGWLVMHYPFDPKWEIEVDGKKQKLYMVNRHFIGIFIKEGEHTVALHYWPHTPLRILMILQMVLVVAVFIVVVRAGLRLHSLKKQ